MSHVEDNPLQSLRDKASWLTQLHRNHFSPHSVTYCPRGGKACQEEWLGLKLGWAQGRTLIKNLKDLEFEAIPLPSWQWIFLKNQSLSFCSVRVLLVAVLTLSKATSFFWSWVFCRKWAALMSSLWRVSFLFYANILFPAFGSSCRSSGL
jgi:hypothetical protein